MFDLTNQVAIVTGGAAGIGRGIVSALREAGAHVVIADIDLEPTPKLLPPSSRGDPQGRCHRP